jgi:hypothetical protein
MAAPSDQLLVAPEVGYARGVLRLAASYLALLAVIAAPVVTSTRLFCRYTGEEIVGCAESRVPEHAQIRGEGCCQRRTFVAPHGVRLLDDQRQRAPAPAAIESAPVRYTAVFAVRVPAVEQLAAPSIGPPAFLGHRALLI